MPKSFNKTITEKLKKRKQTDVILTAMLKCLVEICIKVSRLTGLGSNITPQLTNTIRLWHIHVQNKDLEKKLPLNCVFFYTFQKKDKL